MTGTGEPEQLDGGAVTGDFFDLLGVEAGLGRWVQPSDDRPEAQHVVVLSDNLWKNRFSGDPDILGRSIVLDGEPYAVVGVMPESFWYLGRDIDLWFPFAWSEADWQGNRTSHFLQVVGRLRPGVDARTADAEIKTIARALEAEYPGSNSRLGANIMPLRQRLYGDVRPALLTLLGAVALVLIIACVNVANLLLARVSARGREIAVRMALGAGRARLARLFLAESLILAGLGGLAGMLAATWGVDLLTALLPDTLMNAGGAAPQMTIAWFTFGISMLTGIVFGLAPVLTTPRGDLTRPLNEAGRVVQLEGPMR
jgi:predicted permease